MRYLTWRTVGLTGALLFGGMPSLSAQHPLVTGDSLLVRLTREAVGAGPTVLAQAGRARAATARIRPAGALPDPRLNLGVMDLTLPSFGFRQSDFTEVDVELSQEFPWPGLLRSQTQAAREMARGANADAAVVGREIAVRLAMAYYRLRYVVTAEQTLASQWSLLENAVGIATARYGTGSVPQSDPLQARVALARLVTEQAALQAEEAGLRAELRQIRGVSGPEQLAVEALNVDSVAALLEEVEPEHANQIYSPARLDEHPRLVSQQASIAAADATARAEALAGRPDFELTARYGARPLGSDFFSAFVGIRLPLWASRKQRLSAQAASLDAESLRHGLDDTHLELSAELERTQAGARADAVRLRLLIHSVLPLTRESVDAALRGYRTGGGNFLTVLTAVDAAYRARLEATEVAASHLTHLVMLAQLLRPEESP